MHTNSHFATAALQATTLMLAGQPGVIWNLGLEGQTEPS